MSSDASAVRSPARAPRYASRTAASSIRTSRAPFFTGIHGNYLKPSIIAAGLDPNNLPIQDKDSANFGSTRSKPWKDIWGAGQGVGNIDAVEPVADIVARLEREYLDSIRALNDNFTLTEELAS